MILTNEVYYLKIIVKIGNFFQKLLSLISLFAKLTLKNKKQNFNIGVSRNPEREDFKLEVKFENIFLLYLLFFINKFSIKNKALYFVFQYLEPCTISN